MDRNLAIQYTAVGLIIIAALIWLVIKFIKRKKGKGACCGCVLSEKCTSYNKSNKTHAAVKDCNTQHK